MCCSVPANACSILSIKAALWLIPPVSLILLDPFSHQSSLLGLQLLWKQIANIYSNWLFHILKTPFPTIKVYLSMLILTSQGLPIPVLTVIMLVGRWGIKWLLVRASYLLCFQRTQRKGLIKNISKNSLSNCSMECLRTHEYTKI